MLRHFLLFFVLCLSANMAMGQRALIRQAHDYLKHGKYQESLDIYNSLENIDGKKDLLYYRGLSSFGVNDYRSALEDFTKAFNQGYRDRKLYYYTGRTLHRLGRYKEAARFYKDFLKNERDEVQKGKVIEFIKQAGYAANAQYADQYAYVENLGPYVNTSYDEISPLVSPSSNDKYYFSSNREGSTGGLRDEDGYTDEVMGKFYHDLYAVELKNGNWSSIIAFDPILNGPKNDVIQGFNSYGNVLFYIKTLNMNTGELLTDTFMQDRPQDKFPAKFEGPIKTEYGDKCISIFDDKTILFSSNRLNGHGGYDIYAIKYLDSFWSEPINLGPEVNTEFNEVDPFLTKSGSKLYFSSDRTEGFGGYDVYTNNYGLETRKWGKTENIGLPINSPADDRYFSLSGDGQTGILASDRVGTIGGFDLYLAYMKEAVLEQAMASSGLPYLIAKEEMMPLDTADFVAIDTTVIEEPGGITVIPETPVIGEHKELYIKNLFYGDDENVLNPSNLVTLGSIIDMMKVYPKTEVVLSGHSIIEGLPEFDLYFSIKRAEKVAEYMKTKGIDLSRIYVKGLGPNFPAVKMNTYNISRSAKINNRKIDISLIPNGERVQLFKEKQVILDNVKDPRDENYRTIVKGLSYKVNFASVKQMYKGDVLERFPDATLEKRADQDTYVYSFGIFEKYKDARSLKNRLIQQNLLDATIVPYLDGVRIPIYKIDELASEYHDLEDYILFER